MPRTVRTLRGALVAAALLGAAAIGVPAVDSPATGSTAAAGGFHAEYYDDCGKVRTKPDGSEWTCSFVDDFDQGKLDTTKWVTQDTKLTGFSTEKTCLTTSDENLRVAGGRLYLIARDVGDPFDCMTGVGNFWTEYTGAMIGTRSKWSQTYGTFEIRAKFPTARAPGVHGGFWMNPLKQTYGTWPRSGEIDVAEWWSSDPTLVIPSLHFTGRDGKVDSGWDCKVTNASAWHTYMVEWSATGFRFFIDHKLCFSRRPEPTGLLTAPQPFDKPFSMVLNMGVGTVAGPNEVSDATPLPATFIVDYVKAWH